MRGHNRYVPRQARTTAIQRRRWTFRDWRGVVGITLLNRDTIIKRWLQDVTLGGISSSSQSRGCGTRTSQMQQVSYTDRRHPAENDVTSYAPRLMTSLGNALVARRRKRPVSAVTERTKLGGRQRRLPLSSIHRLRLQRLMYIANELCERCCVVRPLDIRSLERPAWSFRLATPPDGRLGTDLRCQFSPLHSDHTSCGSFCNNLIAACTIYSRQF